LRRLIARTVRLGLADARRPDGACKSDARPDDLAIIGRRPAVR
jgi:hypothetical protein